MTRGDRAIASAAGILAAYALLVIGIVVDRQLTQRRNRKVTE